MLVTGCVGNTKNAIRLMESDVDFVIAQGYEGGGHTGRIGTMSLIPQVTDAVSPLPVVAAGGIAASANAFVMTRQGFTDVAVYTASLQEWASDESLPMEVAPDPDEEQE